MLWVRKYWTPSVSLPALDLKAQNALVPRVGFVPIRHEELDVVNFEHTIQKYDSQRG